ncbi:MAG: 1-acyl-sn-glycerol-3-phosphate acyltransferase [Myxococcales bacterium]|nr:MAG: 1-acyl-sn-glycerol-3-phosphate acyltransferase [Myxococcales bacterium]
MDERWSGSVSDAAARGLVVYVMRSISWLDFLCLDFLLKRYGLPLVHFANDLGLWILEPFGKGERRLSLRRQVPEENALRKTLQDKASALLFLRRPPSLAAKARRGETPNEDLIKVLVAEQRASEQPILLVPQTFVWTKLPPNRQRGLLDMLFGPSEWPGRLRVLTQFILNYRNVLLRSGKPFDLSAFVEAHRDLSDERIAEKIRYALLRRLERERTLVLGPIKKGPARLRDEILRSPRVRKHMQSAMRTTGKALAAIQKEASRDLKKLIAAPSSTVLAMLHRMCEWVWHKIYDGLVVDKEGLAKVREAARQGTLVFLPSHKSHMDYIVLDDVLYANAILPPLVAAGDNLSFWPIGPILRRAGAFFIRRSFRGSKLYSALVDAYIRKIIVEGFNLEFFIEGGRSRTGKLLMPKFGLLSMVVDAIVTLRNKKVFFVPIYIGYERIIEEESYQHEVSGGEKRKENFSEFLKSTRVLRSRYGRLYVEFGQILDFDQVAQQYKLKRNPELPQSVSPRDLSPSMRRALVQHLAHRVAYEINNVTVLTPASLVALALLLHEKRGIHYSEVLRLCDTLLVLLREKGVRLSEPLEDEQGKLRDDAVAGALSLFVDSRLVTQHGDSEDPILSVPEERRVALEYYKNNILHFFVPRALNAVALLAGGKTEVDAAKLKDRVLNLSKFFKHEFIFRVGVSFETAFEEELRGMIDRGEFQRKGDMLVIGEGEAAARLSLYASMIRSYLESYFLAVRASQFLIKGPMTHKEWSKRALAMGQRMYLSGEIQRRESLSRPNLDNALKAMRDHHLVALESSNEINPGKFLKSMQDVQKSEQYIKKFII